MTLEDFANLAEIIGGLGVLMTLVYLALEVRRNTSATRQQSYHDLVTRRSAWFESIAANPELMGIFIAGMKGADLDETESQQYVSLMINFMSHFQDVYMQRRTGIVEDSVWEAERRILAATTAAIGFKNWWKQASQYFVKEFVEEVARVEGVFPVIYDQANHEWTRPKTESPWEHANITHRSK